MKLKIFLTLFAAAGCVAASAQGFKDAVEYFRADQPEEAEIIINRTISQPTTDQAVANYYLGQIAYQRGNLANAKQFFDKGLAANPQSAVNLVGLGQLELKNGNKAAAEDLFKQARSINKKDSDVIVEIARAYYNVDPALYQKEIEKTIADARKVDKNNPLIFILEADIKAPTNVGEAAGYYEMAMNSATASEHPEAFVKYARTYFPVDQRYALQGLQKLLEISPNSALAQRELAEKYYDSDRLTLAAEQYGKYIQNPNHFKKDEQRYVGLLFFGEKYQESNDLAAKLLAEDPDNYYMKRMRLYNFAALGQNEQAVDAANKLFASSNAVFSPKDYTTYGEVLQAMGQDSLATVQYELAVASAPEKLDLLKDLSSAYTTAEMFGKAAEAQQRFVDAGDYTTNDLMVLARRYQNAAASAPVGSPERAQYSKRAVEVIEDVYSKVPDNYQVNLTRARIQLIANDNELNEDVAKTFKDVLAILDADPENLTARRNDYIFIYNQLGKYYLGQKDNATALMYYDKFLEIDPENEALRNFVDTTLRK